MSIVASLVTCAIAPDVCAGDLIIKDSGRSVRETGDALVSGIAAKGLTVFARVDHAAGAASAGLSLDPSEVVIFGNPKVGTPLMQASPTVGLDLPMRVLIWQDKGGAVKIGYLDPAKLKERHSIVGQDAVIGQMTSALDGLTSAAAGAR
ncbi:MAG: DUF302 domain-containing protein [Hyphomicrobiaceae bacterium]|nr:DUF302 domain-containing protein [Hyphomicrobiaceae bacterium]